MIRSGLVDVLVVDDSNFFAELTADKLETNHEIKTWTAGSGETALSLLAERSIDCVVSDYQMPSMDGLELYERIETEYDMPFILVTAEGDESVASKAISAGVDDYLQKAAVAEQEHLELLANRIRNVVSQHRTRQKYQLLVDNTPDEIVEVSSDGEIRAANRAVATAFGVDRVTLVGKQLSDLLPDDVAASRLEHGQRAITAGSAVTFQDSVGVRHFHNIAVPLSETGEGDSVQLITREITQQKRREQELETKTEELEVINRIVRHDINNDVQLLMAWADGVTTNVDEEGLEYVDRIQNTCDHIAELTAIARDFVDSLADDDVIELDPINVSSVLESEVEKKSAAFDYATIAIDGDLPSVSVRANELLSSVFSNLISNAVRHNDRDDPEVTVNATVEDDTVRVCVADNGPGVPDNRKSEIFGKGEMGPESPGTGIGLYLVHTLVEQYGGTVHVEDNDPEGAVFVVELPKHSRSPAAESATFA